MRPTDVVGDNALITAARREVKNFFIISTVYKTVETEDVAFAATLLQGLVARLKDQPGVEVTFWARDWRAYEYALKLAGVTATDVGSVAPYPGSYIRGFRSIWKA